MKPLVINERLVEINYPEELEPYLNNFDRLQYRGEKLQSCSPFRNERRPSFAVNLENGSWVDSGADSESMRKGSFIQLLCFFRGESFEDTAQYLLEKYTHYLDDTESLKLNIQLEFNSGNKVQDLEEIHRDKLGALSRYLKGRGISEKIQRFFKTGEDNSSIALPWRDSQGKLINIKFRSTKDKRFWYLKDGELISNYVFGLYEVKRWLKSKEEQGIPIGSLSPVWLVESEIDALYLWANGYPSVAFGGSSMNIKQERALLNSGIKNIILATDNDVVGERFKSYLSSRFGGVLNCSFIKFPANKKDINDLTPEEIMNCYQNKVISNCLLNLELS